MEQFVNAKQLQRIINEANPDYKIGYNRARELLKQINTRMSSCRRSTSYRCAGWMSRWERRTNESAGRRRSKKRHFPQLPTNESVHVNGSLSHHYYSTKKPIPPYLLMIAKQRGHGMGRKEEYKWIKMHFLN